MQKPYVIGVAGGSGSGKTHFAMILQNILGAELCSILYQDNYYFDQSESFNEEGGTVNFDHPSSLDFARMARDLAELRSGRAVRIPMYDFKTHSRLPETLMIPITPIILVDGILILNSPELRSVFDESIFFDTPEALRFERRLQRDVIERGRTPEGVRRQFESQVRPMHNQFVEPSKVHAQTIVKDLGEYSATLSTFSQKLRDQLASGAKSSVLFETTQ